MSLELLQQGIFETISDVYIVEYLPISNIVAFGTHSDITEDEDAQGKFFEKFFNYTVNGGAESGWISLTDANLQAIPVNSIEDVFMLKIRYRRAGSDSSGTISWKKIVLDNIQATACILLRFNFTEWNAVYGDIEKVQEINDTIQRFNKWSLEKFGLLVFVIDDNTIPDLKMFLEVNQELLCGEDLNVFLKQLWGNYFVDQFFKIEINLYNGDRS